MKGTFYGGSSVVDLAHDSLISHRYYYQYKIECLSTCTLTIHGLLHIAQDIRNCGPVWTTWTFYMERFCNMLQRIRRSQAHPWSNLDISLVHMVYLEQLAVRFDLSDELARIDDRKDDGAIGHERSLIECRWLYSTSTHV